MHLYSSLLRGPIGLAPFPPPLLPLTWDGRGAAALHDCGGVGCRERRECRTNTLTIPEEDYFVEQGSHPCSVVVRGVAPTVEGGFHSK